MIGVGAAMTLMFERGKNDLPSQRRTAPIATASLLLSSHVSAANAENVLSWTVTPPGRKRAVLFGYEQIAAAAVSDIVKDGDALVASSQRVVMDMPQKVQLPPVSLGKLKPILQVVSPQRRRTEAILSTRRRFPVTTALLNT